MSNTKDELMRIYHKSVTEFYQQRGQVNHDDFLIDRMIAHGVTVQQWIPVSERLPKEDGKYLVCKNLLGDSFIKTVWFARDGRKVSQYDFENRWKNVWYEYDSEYGHIALDDVTHWMPLPEPPKGE